MLSSLNAPADVSEFSNKSFFMMLPAVFNEKETSVLGIFAVVPNNTNTPKRREVAMRLKRTTQMSLHELEPVDKPLGRELHSIVHCP